MTRRRIYEIIEPSTGSDRVSAIYDCAMIAVILASLLPLAFKDTTSFLNALDRISVCIFILDYLLRLMTADYKLKKGPISFPLYPITFMALLDLLCILPSFTPMASGVRLLKIIRLLRTFRVFRAAKMFRYSRSIVMIVDVIREQRTALLAVGSLAVGYILVSALVIFNIEPDSFETFFDAVYWATVSLTTVGYGDIYPISTAGRVITMLSSILGIAVVALPAGIITAGYMDRLNKK
ncbi:MAG: ion transporter [Oscillospiraceae bacterium]|nr:ion transporter [Oscillospiraceae bacterium]